MGKGDEWLLRFQFIDINIVAIDNKIIISPMRLERIVIDPDLLEDGF